MHPCPGNWVAIGCAVIYIMLGLPTHLVQELDVGTVCSNFKSHHVMFFLSFYTNYDQE